MMEEMKAIAEFVKNRPSFHITHESEDLVCGRVHGPMVELKFRIFLDEHDPWCGVWDAEKGSCTKALACYTFEEFSYAIKTEGKRTTAI